MWQTYKKTKRRKSSNYNKDSPQSVKERNNILGGWLHECGYSGFNSFIQHLKLKKTGGLGNSLLLSSRYERVVVHYGKGHMTYAGVADTHSLSPGHRQHHSIAPPCQNLYKARRNLPINRA